MYDPQAIVRRKEISAKWYALRTVTSTESTKTKGTRIEMEIESKRLGFDDKNM